MTTGPSSPMVEPAFLALRELFGGPLRSASFPSIDATTLADLVAEAERRAEAVAAARASLASAQAELAAAENAFAEQRAALTRTSHTAIAYARVFAKDDRELLAAIDRVVLPKLRAPTPRAASSRPTSAASDTRAAPRKRGRPPKSVAAASAPADADVVAAE